MHDPAVRACRRRSLAVVGQTRDATLGTDIASGERPQHVVPAGRWFGAAPAPGTDYALVGCSVAPGFEFSTFELGNRARLAAKFPGSLELIQRLT